MIRFLGCGGLARLRVDVDALLFYLVFLKRGHWAYRCLYYCGWLLCGLQKTGLCGRQVLISTVLSLQTVGNTPVVYLANGFLFVLFCLCVLEISLIFPVT